MMHPRLRSAGSMIRGMGPALYAVGLSGIIAIFGLIQGLSTSSVLPFIPDEWTLPAWVWIAGLFATVVVAAFVAYHRLWAEHEALKKEASTERDLEAVEHKLAELLEGHRGARNALRKGGSASAQPLQSSRKRILSFLKQEQGTLGRSAAVEFGELRGEWRSRTPIAKNLARADAEITFLVETLKRIPGNR